MPVYVYVYVYLSVPVWGGEISTSAEMRQQPQTKCEEYKGNARFVYTETYSNIYTLCLPLISR